MNIKTTIILLVLLLGVGAIVFFNQDKDNGIAKPQVHTLVDVKSTDVTRFVITGSDGKTIDAQKSTDSGGMAVWKLTQPVSASADAMKVSTLLDSITSLKSTAEVSAIGTDAPHTGLDKPQYTVDLYAGTKDTKLTVGDALTVSDGVYVKVNDQDTVDVVPSSLVDSLSKPANDLRKTQLFETASPSVQQLTITHKDGSQLVLEKQTSGWQIVKPVKMPADQSAVEDLVSSVVNMTPVEFVDEPSLLMGLNKPVATATFSAQAPTTQPTATPPTAMPGGVTVKFGGYDDVEKKNIFVELPDGSIVKVAASVLDSLNKKPLDIRDKTVIDLDPATITRLVIDSNQSATTQPVAPAVKKSIVMARRKKTVAVGPTLPGKTPTTAPAPQTDWVIGDQKPADADDSKVTSLLGELHPLKADQFLPVPALGKSVKQYLLTITTSSQPKPLVIKLVDPGADAELIGSYNDLTFQIPRTLGTDLSGEFKK